MMLRGQCSPIVIQRRAEAPEATARTRLSRPGSAGFPTTSHGSDPRHRQQPNAEFTQPGRRAVRWPGTPRWRGYLPQRPSASGPEATTAVPTASPPSPVHPAEDINPLVVTRSEEQRVATESVPVGTVRVSKHIITEEKTITVQLRREELRLEHEPLTEHPGHDAAHELGTGEDVVIVLYAERANVTTEIVPIERVTVHTDVLTEQQSLWGTVSHEEITINDDAQATQLE